MTPEQRARQNIDRKLADSGWLVQSIAQMNIHAGPGVAVREFPLKTGVADYLLYIDGKVAGVIEAKPEGHTLIGVETQSGKTCPSPTSWPKKLSMTWRRRLNGFGWWRRG